MGLPEARFVCDEYCATTADVRPWRLTVIYSRKADANVANLEARAEVRVIQTRGDWDLVARNGHIIGYVEVSKLKAIEGPPARSRQPSLL